MASLPKPAPRQTAVIAALLLLILVWTIALMRPTSILSDVTAPKAEAPEAGKPQQQQPGLDPANTTTLSAPPDDELRPLVLYAYADSESARENLRFFVDQGLHAAADFVFILNGVGNGTDLDIPRLDNVRVVPRPDTCYDLGAYGEVLRSGDLWRRYKRFIMLNASVRGPFLPYWSRSCWSDLYLRKVTGKVKLVGMTSNCFPEFHVQSMIWATDSVGMDLLLNPPSTTLEADDFGDEGEAVGLAGCYGTWTEAVHAEIGATRVVRSQGYDVDVMMAAFHKSRDFIAECAGATRDEDVLHDGKYFGTNVHPYETVFIKADRGIDPAMIESLTKWHEGAKRNSWDVCGTSSAW